ncbi:uncharacterized protein LOC131948331 [Physella acuta]|uniref:uncharacterized protein LOC131948331 n=1 Tax=Physella acuta TaxID=109671 RepID=UPI0027DD91CF|nr:uncharacterized protein LOC131948331 [Physella acuta]
MMVVIPFLLTALLLLRYCHGPSNIAVKEEPVLEHATIFSKSPDIWALKQAHTVIQHPHNVMQGSELVVTCDPRMAKVDVMADKILSLDLSCVPQDETTVAQIATFRPTNRKGPRLTRNEKLGKNWRISLVKSADEEGDMSVKLQAVKRKSQLRDSGLYTCGVEYIQNKTVIKETFDSTLLVTERVPAYIVGPEPVHVGDTYKAVCDARRVSMSPDVTTIKHVTILRSPGCDRRYAVVVRLDYKNNKSTRKMHFKAHKNWEVELKGDFYKPFNRDAVMVKLTVTNSSTLDSGCFQCRVGCLAPGSNKVLELVAEEKVQVTEYIEEPEEKEVKNETLVEEEPTSMAAFLLQHINDASAHAYNNLSFRFFSLGDFVFILVLLLVCAKRLVTK